MIKSKRIIIIVIAIIVVLSFIVVLLTANNENNKKIRNQTQSESITNNIATDSVDPSDISEESSDDKTVEVGTSEKNNTVDEFHMDRPVLRVCEATCKAGDSVRMKISIENNPGVLGVVFSVYFDETVLTIKSVENGNAFDGILTMTKPQNLVSGSCFVWDGQELNSSDIKDGTVLEIEFTVDKNAAEGRYPITVGCDRDDAVDGELSPIEFVILNNYIEVKK